MTISKIPKYDYIDALRGLAVLGVLMVHTSQKVIPGEGLFGIIMANGDKGVQLFFLVSAFTLSLSIDHRRKFEIKPNLNFFIRRFFRIAPLFYLAILYYLIQNGMGSSYYEPNGLNGWSVFLTATFMHGWNPETINSVVPGGWSIAVEFTFYLFLPFLLRILSNKERAIVFFLIFSFLNYYISQLIYGFWETKYPEEQSYLVWGLSYYGFFNQLPVFAIGIILFHIYKNSTFNHKLSTSLVFALLAIFLMITYTTYCSYYNFITQLSIYAVAFSLLAYALANHKLSLFVNPITMLIGKVSFSMYLVHFALLDFFNRFQFFKDLNRFHTFGSLLAIGLICLFTMLISIVTYNLIEKNGIKLGSLIIRKIEQKQVTPLKI